MAHETDGYYEVDFQSNDGNIGAGKVTLQDLKLSGVDIGYLYDGIFSEISEGEYAGHIEVKQHNKEFESIFGDYSEYKLSVKGRIKDGKADLKATVVGMDHLAMQVRMSRKSTTRRPRGF